MPAVYTPGLRVTPKAHLRYRRTLPIPGEVRVRMGQQVKSTDIVAETQMPGNITPLNVANLLSVSPGDVPGCMLKQEGEFIAAGQPLARSRGIFGFFRRECTASIAGVIESVSGITGLVILRGDPIPLRVTAYLSGTVTEILPSEGVVVEGEGTLVQGIFGIGPETFGPLKLVCDEPDEPLEADRLDEQCRGAIVVGGGRVTAEALQHAAAVGVAGIVTGGIDDYDLRNFLGYDLGVAVTGSEKVGLTLIITEGFGDIAMAERTFRVLRSRQGNPAACNGATQIRAGVIRPEVIVPGLPGDSASSAGGDAQAAGVLEVGSTIRIIRDPYFGLLGKIAALPPEPRWLDSGAKARVAEVRLEDGRRLTVPRANVELIEG